MEKAYNKNNKFTGAIYGAWNDSNDPYHKERDRHARIYYQQIRNRDKTIEIRRVSQNSGFPISEIEQIFDHIFIKEHELHDGRKRFDPSYEMAESWRRLSESHSKNIQAHDLMMLKHEFLESRYMQEGLSYIEAHNETDKLFNYYQSLKQWQQERGDSQ